MLKLAIFLSLLFMSTESHATQYETKTITADGTTCIEVDTNGISDNQMWKGTIDADGDFGGGTISWVKSYDGGATTLAVFDKTGVAETSTSDDSMNVEHGRVNYRQTEPSFCAVMSGSTSPSVVFRITDNN